MEKYDWKVTIRVNILKLKFIGLWPADESYKPNLYAFWATISLFIIVCGHNFFQTANLIVNFNDLEVIVGTGYITLPCVMAIPKAYYVIKNMAKLKNLMVTLDSDIFQPRNDRQLKLIQPTLTFWKLNYAIFWAAGIAASILWSTYPFLDGSVKQQQLPFMAWYPYDTTISFHYKITYLYQVFGIVFVATTAMSVDSLISALNMYIGVQFDILCDDLRHLFNDTLETDVDCSKKLISCIYHHKAILQFAKSSNDFFNWIAFAQFFISALAIGITMFRLTMVIPFSSEFMSILFYSLSILAEIFIYCWFGNEVEVKSREIPYAVFESNWVNASMDVKKKIMIFFVLRCQTPLKMSALNLFYLSLDTFVKILRAAWSYFALLHQVSSRK